MLVLVRALGLQAYVNGNFTNGMQKDYYYEAVGIAKKLGIVTGIDG